MAKVTSKLQVTIPKAIADRYAIEPGDEIDWIAANDAIRVVPAKSIPKRASVAMRLRLFDAATERQRARQATTACEPRREEAADRGWTREELYDRGRAD